jgi:hypothetical protein
MKTKQLGWKAILQDAVRETDPAKAAMKTHAAETAIFNRIGDTLLTSGFAEEQELFEALDTIRLLKNAQQLRQTAHPLKSKSAAA